MIVAWSTAEWKTAMQFHASLPCDTNPTPPPKSSAEVGSVWRAMPQGMMQALLLDEWEVTLLASRAFLSPWQRNSAKTVWDLRSVKPEAPMPSITAASYHTCTSMPEHHVRAKGLYVPLVETSKGFRRLGKWEILHSLGMPLSLCLPRSEKDAVSLLGESFPPAHALCSVLLAIANRPSSKWSSEAMAQCFYDGCQHLSPAPVKWEDLREVTYQGWSKLVLAEHAEQETMRIEMTVKLMRFQVRGDTVLGALLNAPSLSRDPPDEKSFFEEDCTPDCVLAEIYRPNWGKATLEIQVHGQQLCEVDIAKRVAKLWNLDENITVVQRVCDSKGLVYVADEVATHNVPQRLVLLDMLPCRALWVDVPLHARTIAARLGMTEVLCSVSINQGPPTNVASAVEDGDMLRMTMAPHTPSYSSTGALNPLQVRHDRQMCDWDLFPLTMLDSSPSEGTALEPTQRFQVTLQAQQTREDMPFLEDGDQTTKRKWQTGGLRGGASAVQEVCIKKGWRIQVLDSEPVQLPMHLIQGRTLRQERELLGLNCLDTTKTYVTLVTLEGSLITSWQYKFPYTAKDDAVLILHVTPHAQASTMEVHSCVGPPFCRLQAWKRWRLHSVPRFCSNTSTAVHSRISPPRRRSNPAGPCRMLPKFQVSNLSTRSRSIPVGPPSRRPQVSPSRRRPNPVEVPVDQLASVVSLFHSHPARNMEIRSRGTSILRAPGMEETAVTLTASHMQQHKHCIAQQDISTQQGHDEYCQGFRCPTCLSHQSLPPASSQQSGGPLSWDHPFHRLQSWKTRRSHSVPP